MSYRAVLTGAGVLIAFASCEAPDGTGLYRPLVDVPAMASSEGAADAGVTEQGGGGASGMLVGTGAELDAGPNFGEGQGGAIGLVGASGSGAQPVSTLADAGSIALGEDAGPARDAAPPPPPCSANIELCDGLDNDCDDLVDEGTACAADCAGFALVDRGYMFCSTSVVRDIAADRCEAEGMRLAWIETAQENQFLIDSIAVADVPAAEDPEILTYIGASDSGNEGNWIWRGRGAIPDSFQFWQGGANGNAVNGAFESWSPTEPNNTDDDENCGVLSVLGNNNRDPGNWDDRDCDSALPFVCEVP